MEDSIIMRSRSRFGTLTVAAVLAAALPAGVYAQATYPAGPLRIVSPYAPGGTPREIVRRLQLEVARALNLPELKERLAGEGMTVVASTPEDFVDFLARESAKYNRIIQAAGIKNL